MKAGSLRHRITFEALTTELDSDGAASEVWADAFGQKFSAEIAPLSGRELMAAQAVQSKVSARIRVRYFAGITASLRAVHRGTVYNIEAVIPDDESGRRWLTLNCSTGVNEG